VGKARRRGERLHAEAAYGPRAPACSADLSAEVAPRPVAPVGKARRRGERLHAEVAPRPVAPVAISGNQRQSVAAISGPLAPRPVAPGAIWARLASDTLAVPWAQHW